MKKFDMVNETEKEKTIKIADVIKSIVGLGIYVLVGYGIYCSIKWECKKHNLARQFLRQNSIEQKVEFSIENGKIMGHTDPNTQRIYFRQDVDNDGWQDTYYIEDPFCKDKFGISRIDYGKNHIPSD